MKKMLVNVTMTIEIDVAEDTSDDLCRELGQDVAASMTTAFSFEDEAASIVSHEITDVDMEMVGEDLPATTLY